MKLKSTKYKNTQSNLSKPNLVYSKLYIKSQCRLGFGFMVFNATFNNFSFILWCSVLFVEKTTSLSQVTDKL